MTIEYVRQMDIERNCVRLYMRVPCTKVNVMYEGKAVAQFSTYGEAVAWVEKDFGSSGVTYEEVESSRLEFAGLEVLPE